MKCASVPSAYRNCILRASVRTARNFSPARNVRSITAPSAARRSFVRTNAPPLPGLTCWNSTILKTVPSTSMWLPFLNWLVEITAIQLRGAAGRAEPRRGGRPFRVASSREPGACALIHPDEILRGAREDIPAALRDHDEILDPHAAAAGQVDARLDGDDVARHERIGARPRQARSLVDLHADPVPEAVPEVLYMAGRGDHVARHGVDVTALGAGAHGIQSRLLGT